MDGVRRAAEKARPSFTSLLGESVFLFLLFLFMLGLAVPLWRFIAVFMPVSLALWTLSWAVTTSTPGYGKYMVVLVFVLLAARSISKFVNRP